MTMSHSKRPAEPAGPLCATCGGATRLVRVTPVANADHDSRVYACTQCGALRVILVELLVDGQTA
jgi:hypothetical protein